MYNINYAPEIATANAFIEEHRHDMKLRGFLRDRKDNLNRETHSERWSLIFDWMAEHYPGASGTLVTGLAYWMED